MAVALADMSPYQVEQSLPSPMFNLEKSRAVPFPIYRSRPAIKDSSDGWLDFDKDFNLSRIVKVIGLPADFEEELSEALDAIRSLEANWDEDGALKPDAGNIDHAAIFVRKAFDFLGAEGSMLTVPELNAGPDGSVDVVWRKKRSFLIVNFADGARSIGSYYFDQDRNETLGRQGRLDIALPIPSDFQFYLREIAE